MAKSFYVTGTDTEIGKTFVTCALLREARAAGMDVIGMKPVASGCIDTEAGWRSEDTLAHIAADGQAAPYIDRNPYALPLPVAPEIAAREAAVDIQLGDITQAYARLRASQAAVLVEGVGGWLAPLSATLDQSHLVQALQLPVVMVVGLRLGCLNHARLTARAIAADGCELVGWVANHVDPAMDRQDENFELLSARMPAPCWGRIPCSPGSTPEALSKWLRLPPVTA